MKTAIVLATAWVFAPSLARAQTRVDVGVGTVAPLYLGTQVLAELPGRFLVGVEAGFMPAPYASFINGIAQSFDAYNDETAQIIESAITGAFVFRPSIGFRPSRELGLEVLAGYTLLVLSEDITGIDIIKDAVRRSSSAISGEERVDLSSTIHGFHLTVAYSWQLAEHLALRGSLGYMQAVASSTSIDAPAIEQREPNEFRILAATLDRYLNDKYTTYVKLPTLGLTLNYRF